MSVQSRPTPIRKQLVVTFDDYEPFPFEDRDTQALAAWLQGRYDIIVLAVDVKGVAEGVPDGQH